MTEPNSPPVRCPCGFFGSPQTLGLCSKCYQEREESRNQTPPDMTPRSSASSSSSGADQAHNRVSSASSSAALVIDTSTNFQSSRTDSAAGGTQPLHHSEHSYSTVESRHDSLSMQRVDLSTTNCVSSDNITPDTRGQKRKTDYDDYDECGESSVRSPAKRQRMSSKYCHMCNCRLQLAVREIGRCKCGSVFCLRHRLPEQHNCTFDHKEDGRREARAKMVPARKHVGTTLKRLDSDS